MGLGARKRTAFKSDVPSYPIWTQVVLEQVGSLSMILKSLKPVELSDAVSACATIAQHATSISEKMIRAKCFMDSPQSQRQGE